MDARPTRAMNKLRRTVYIVVCATLALGIVGVALWIFLKANSDRQVEAAEIQRNISQLLPEVAAEWPYAENFFNSVFFTSIAGAFAGALGGAWAAQRIAERVKSKDELIKEIRATNASILLAFGICNTLIVAKRQVTLPMKSRFDQDLVKIDEVVRNAKQTGPPVNLKVIADYRALTPVDLPISILEDHVFEKLSLRSRPLLATTTLTRVTRGLNDTLMIRNNLIERIKAMPLTSFQKLLFYFGRLNIDGSYNQEYSSLLDGICKQTDAGIFYSHEFCNELVKHGNEVSDSFRRKFREEPPRIVKPNFDQAKEAGLMPDESDYADWRGAVVEMG